MAQTIIEMKYKNAWISILHCAQARSKMSIPISNGNDIVEALILRLCQAVSDCSFKYDFGLAVWIWVDSQGVKLQGHTTVPGQSIKQGSF